MFYLQLVGCFI